MVYVPKSKTQVATGSGSGGKLPWEVASAEMTVSKALMEVYGDTGTGRTCFALSAPGPIALIHAAEKLEGIVQKYAGEKEIRLLNYGRSYTGTDDDIAKEAYKVWEMIEAAFYDAFGWARTVVLDTHTEAWELIRLAHFGALKPTGGRVDANYGPVNNRWRSLFKAARNQTKANVIVIGQTKDEYKKSKSGQSAGMGERTGETIRAGQKEVPYFADVIVRTHKAIDGGQSTFSSVIEKGWFRADLEGLELPGELSTFPSVMGMITDDGDTSRWEV